MANPERADDRFAPLRAPAGVIARPRLLSRFDEPWDALIVEGPAGSGKTTLATQWAEREPDAVWWFDAAAESVGRATAILGEREGAVVVVDRAQRLTAAAIAGLGAALDRGPKTRLILLTRSAATAPALEAATGQTILLLAPDELRVDDDELDALLPKLDHERRRRITASTDRLMVAVRDAAETRGTQAIDRFRAALLADLADRPGPYRDALARLATVQALDTGLATAIGVDPELLELAAQDGLGASSDGWFDLTAFAARVIEPLAVDLGPVARQHIVATALAHPALRAERPYEALRLAIATRDYDAATQIVLEYGFGIIDEPDRARRALNGVGYAEIKHHPLLIVLVAQLANLDRTTRVYGLTLFGRAIAAMTIGRSDANPHEAAAFRALSATLLRLTPLADQALPRSLRALAALERLDPAVEPNLEVAGAQLLTHVGLTAMAAGDDDVAATMYERAYGLLKHLDSPEQLDPLSLRAALAAFRGELPLARRLASTADEAGWPGQWRYGLRGQGLELALAILELEAGDPDGALRHLTSTGPIGELLEHWALFATVQSWRDLLAGEHVQGLGRLRAVREERARTPTTSVSRARMAAAEAMLLLAGGDAGAAKQAAAGAARHVPEGILALGQAHLALGRASDAGIAVGRLASRTLGPRVGMGAELLRATIALRAGDAAGAQAPVLRLADLARQHRLRLPLRLLAEEDRALLASAAELLGEHELVADLAATRAAAPVRRRDVPRLTPREQALLATLDETSSVADLAARHFVSVNTVKTQLRSLYRKLEAGSREEAIARAAASGLIRSDRLEVP